MELTRSDVLAWCKQQHEQGEELKIQWTGGGDSGYAEWVGTAPENEYTDYLIDLCYDELDYGSWAGEFSSNGQVDFSLEENAFVGEDDYSEDDYFDYEINLEFRFPKSIQFDDCHFEVDCPHDERCSFNLTLTLKNGFNDAEFQQKTVEDLEILLEQHVVDNMQKYIDECNNDYLRCYHSDVIPRSDFHEDGDDVVYVLKYINYTREEIQTRNIFINLDIAE